MQLPGLELAKLPADAVEVGSIADAWGVQGWFRVRPYSASPAALLSAKQWFLLLAGAQATEGAVKIAVQAAKAHTNAVVAQAQQIADRTAAQALRGARVFVPRSSFPKTEKDEYYWVDLVGLEVLNREQISLGVVQELLATGGPQTVLVVSSIDHGKRHEHLIPFVSTYVDQVDVPARRIWVDWQPDF